LYPHYAETWDEEIRENLKIKILSNDKIKAVGEIGLDYYYLDKTKDIQEQKRVEKEVFIDQINLAMKLELPVIVHTRDAEEDTYEILKRYKSKKILIHCFSGTKEFARKMIDLGFYLSFSGIVTFDKTGEIKKVLQEVSLDKILVETDSPYLAPVPKRGKSNEPAFVKYVFDYIKELRGEENLEEIIEGNFKEFFGI